MEPIRAVPHGPSAMGPAELKVQNNLVLQILIKHLNFILYFYGSKKKESMLEDRIIARARIPGH